jgi:osmotically-inducible protein OsmY
MNREFIKRMRLLLQLAVLIAFTVVTTPAKSQDATSNETSEPKNAPAESVSVVDVAEDSAIRYRLIKIYDSARKAGWLTDPKVVLDSGIVTLQGEADTDEHRDWAANVARKTQDVVDGIETRRHPTQP